MERSIGVSGLPKGKTQHAVSSHPGVVSKQRRERTVLRGIIVGDRLGRVLACSHRISNGDEIVGHDLVGRHEQTRVVNSFGQREHLFANLDSCSHLALILRELPEAEQHREELRRLADVVAQLARARVGLPGVGVPVPLRRPEG